MTSAVAGNCSVGLLRGMLLPFRAAVSFSGDVKFLRARRTPPHNLSGIIYGPVNTTAEYHVETGQTMHARVFFFFFPVRCVVVAQWHRHGVFQCRQGKKSPLNFSANAIYRWQYPLCDTQTPQHGGQGSESAEERGCTLQVSFPLCAKEPSLVKLHEHVGKNHAGEELEARGQRERRR